MSDDLKLTLGPLTLIVEGQEFPASTDPDDTDWLMVRCLLKSENSSIDARGPWLRSTELEQFVEELRPLYETLEGEARLWGIEPNLDLIVRGASLGRMKVQLDLILERPAETHRIGFDADQTEISILIKQCAAILARFPGTLVP